MCQNRKNVCQHCKKSSNLKKIAKTEKLSKSKTWQKIKKKSKFEKNGQKTIKIFKKKNIKLKINSENQIFCVSILTIGFIFFFFRFSFHFFQFCLIQNEFSAHKFDSFHEMKKID